jgi:hypothetical protein
MVSELPPLDIRQVPDLAALLDEVEATGKRRRIVRDNRDVVVLTPTKRAAPRPRRRKTGVVRADDPLFRLIGIGRSGIPGGISGKKHEALGRLRHT